MTIVTPDRRPEVIAPMDLSDSVDRLIAFSAGIEVASLAPIAVAKIGMASEVRVDDGSQEVFVAPDRVEPGLVWQDLVYPEETRELRAERARARLKVAVLDGEEPLPTLGDAAANLMDAAPSVVKIVERPPNISKERAADPVVVVREAEIEDIRRIVEIDFRMYKNYYGEQPPSETDVANMFWHRFANVQHGRGMMAVCEVDGRVEGFATYFRTRKPWDTFRSWEESTANGTLDGKTDPRGDFAYIVNMTVAPRGSGVRARERLTAALMAQAVEDGIKRAHFVSRMPQFAKWVESQGVNAAESTPEELDALALHYSELRRPEVKKRGNLVKSIAPISSALRALRVLGSPKPAPTVPVDYELRMYEKNKQFERGKLAKAGFGDPESLDYGVLFRVKVPLANQPKIVRNVLAAGLRFVSRHQKIASKMF